MAIIAITPKTRQIFAMFEPKTFPAQKTWLRQQLAKSKTPWQIVYFHRAPYSSGRHGSEIAMQWPFASWGADAVFAGHDHTYEQLEIGGIPYFVNGLGGKSRYKFDLMDSASKIRYNARYGAQRVIANDKKITFDFINVKGKLIDSKTISR